MHRFRPRLTYANVVASLALFVALGGTTYAAATIGAGDIKKDAVLSRHIKNGEVKNLDLGANAVGTGKVIDGSLLKRDFKAGQLAQGPAGLSFHGQFPRDNVFHEITVVKGIRVSIFCAHSAPAIALRLERVDGLHAFYLFGTKTQDAAVSAADDSAQPGAAAEANGSSTVQMDVAAESTATGAPVKFTRFDFSGVLGTKCNYGGLVIPGEPAS